MLSDASRDDGQTLVPKRLSDIVCLLRPIMQAIWVWGRMVIDGDDVVDQQPRQQRLPAPLTGTFREPHL
jgi:hypothetical protein